MGLQSWWRALRCTKQLKMAIVLNSWYARDRQGALVAFHTPARALQRLLSDPGAVNAEDAAG